MNEKPSTQIKMKRKESKVNKRENVRHIRVYCYLNDFLSNITTN